MSKKIATKTLNPLHFEDLEPHRFEDLTRNLIYDFKKWQSIEATGRGGGDDGFDIRAWEQTQAISNTEAEENGIHPMNGNLWEIQCKREKQLGPSKIRQIINDGIEKSNPPYGYILVASANFSKKAYDTFREELRKKGVLEFYLWGRAELEDMLFLPKNDGILFAFFGISLTTRKKTKSSQIKFVVNNKNKLFKILGQPYPYQHNYKLTINHKSILVRNYNDDHYPFEQKYEDFDELPRWKEHIVIGYTPEGIVINAREYFAFVDVDKKEWDYTDAVDLIRRQGNQQFKQNKNEEVEDFYKYLPNENKAKLAIEGLILFKDILVIDEHGDCLHPYPHIFVDYNPSGSPFKGYWRYLKTNESKVYEKRISLNDKDYKKIEKFPKKFPKKCEGKTHKKLIEVAPEVSPNFINTTVDLFDVDGKYSFLKPRDIISISSMPENIPIRITHKYQTTVKNYLTKEHNKHQEEQIEKQIGRKIEKNEKITVLEFERVFAW